MVIQCGVVQWYSIEQRRHLIVMILKYLTSFFSSGFLIDEVPLTRMIASELKFEEEEISQKPPSQSTIRTDFASFHADKMKSDEMR